MPTKTSVRGSLFAVASHERRERQSPAPRSGGAGKDVPTSISSTRDNLGKFNPNNDHAIYQELDGALPWWNLGDARVTSTAACITWVLKATICCSL